MRPRWRNAILEAAPPLHALNLFGWAWFFPLAIVRASISRCTAIVEVDEDGDKRIEERSVTLYQLKRYFQGKVTL